MVRVLVTSKFYFWPCFATYCSFKITYKIQEVSQNCQKLAWNAQMTLYNFTNANKNCGHTQDPSFIEYLPQQSTINHINLWQHTCINCININRETYRLHSINSSKQNVDPTVSIMYHTQKLNTQSSRNICQK
jgi:hypothetical protein